MAQDLIVMSGTGGGTTLPTGSGNLVLATPADGSSAQATLRALVAADIPNIAESQVTGLVSGLALLAPIATPVFTTSIQTPMVLINGTSLGISRDSATGYLAIGNGTFGDFSAGLLSAGLFATGRFSVRASGIMGWSSTTDPAAPADTGISRDGPAGIAFGNGTADDSSAYLLCRRVVYTGSSSGSTVVQALSAASGTLTLPSATGTLVISASPTFTGTAAFTNITVSGTTSFAAGSIAYAALSGTPTLAATLAAVSYKFFTAYDSTTGLFTAAQPAAADITGLATVATSGAYADLTGKPTIPTSFTWDVESNAAGNLSINNAGFTSTFNQTSAVAWLWANTTAATATVPQNSPILNLSATGWGGTYPSFVSTVDNWAIQDVVPTTSLAITNVVEVTGTNVVTLTVAGNTWAVGQVITLNGLTTATWLNGHTGVWTYTYASLSGGGTLAGGTLTTLQNQFIAARNQAEAFVSAGGGLMPGTQVNWTVL
jgi:hypothetical protein